MGTLLIATTNRGKIAEIRPLLSGVPFDLVTLADFAPLAAPEETGSSFAENGRLKALYCAAETGALTVAEDAGLEIKALDGAPGVSRRASLPARPTPRASRATSAAREAGDRQPGPLRLRARAGEGWCDRIRGGGRKARSPRAEGAGPATIDFLLRRSAAPRQAGNVKSTVSPRAGLSRASRLLMTNSPSLILSLSKDVPRARPSTAQDEQWRPAYGAAGGFGRRDEMADNRAASRELRDAGSARSGVSNVVRKILGRAWTSISGRRRS